MDPRLLALNRFGLGARAGERERISDPRAWLRAQLIGGPPVLSAPGEASALAVADALRAFRTLDRDHQRQQQEARRRLVEIAAAEARHALHARVTSDRPFVERLVAFWSNHLCVSAGAKVLVAPLAGSYEREAIRSHVLGRFEDLVLASAKHPAMLFYLDNFQSIGPASRAVSFAASRRNSRGAPRRGLNENYARELLELHTVGVNGGYAQRDVQELAKILTGWTVGGLGRPGLPRSPRPRARRPVAQPAAAGGAIQFAFYEPLHEPGTKTVLGTRYEERGLAEGEQAVRNLCRHPSTAQFIARKLAIHFVADDPTPAVVTRLARVFRDSDGDLRAVAAALIDLDEVWAGDTRKFRTPQEWLIALLRASGATSVADGVIPVLRQLRHPLWSPQSPKGFGDSMQEWADPDSLMNRAELARSVTRRIVDHPVDPSTLLTVIDVPAGDPLRAMLSDTSISANERAALAFAGPAFQWR
jgi:uncharacterized protein (DUF1800 family)